VKVEVRAAIGQAAFDAAHCLGAGQHGSRLLGRSARALGGPTAAFHQLTFT
jgi:hypothetical protein